jgi:GNAT superfamily N-acetyltransferase
VSGITIRFATAEDVAGMAAIGPADPRMSAYFEGRHHPQQALSPRTGFVALDGDQLIGYVAGHLTTRHRCDGEIQYLFVAPSHRRRGVATALVRLLAEWFVSHDARKICIAIADDSPPEARPFYERLGAQPLRRFGYAFPDVSKSMRRPEE